MEKRKITVGIGTDESMGGSLITINREYMRDLRKSTAIDRNRLQKIYDFISEDVEKNCKECGEISTMCETCYIINLSAYLFQEVLRKGE